jgi:hypothetical protein
MKILPLAAVAFALAAAAPIEAQTLPTSPPAAPALEREQNALQIQREQRQLNGIGAQPGAAAERQRLDQLQIQNEQAPPSNSNPTLHNNELQLQLRNEQNRINQLQPSSPAR